MPVGRNDPCPCGSGKKHKKCCGAVIAIVPTPARECGECTACCDGWVTGVIEGHEMYPGNPCYFRGDKCCTIYERRPKYPCRDFVCGWLKPGSLFPEEFRPDRLGVMVINMKWRGREAYMLTPAGREPDANLLAWMREMSIRTGSPFFYSENGQRLGFGPPEFQVEMMERFARGEKLW
jgi:SEC-C motif